METESVKHEGRREGSKGKERGCGTEVCWAAAKPTNPPPANRQPTTSLIPSSAPSTAPPRQSYNLSSHVSPLQRFLCSREGKGEREGVMGRGNTIDNLLTAPTCIPIKPNARVSSSSSSSSSLHTVPALCSHSGYFHRKVKGVMGGEDPSAVLSFLHTDSQAGTRGSIAAWLVHLTCPASPGASQIRTQVRLHAAYRVT
ncbi:hypothetical protein E2C01_052722 [Portunus trituberculatus]|uniref:Uncharacterized protein n=1 Tax=Portunus trituberculatus TaxID=210409 RepID=A0A5B7GQ50_PORTR|nr:hypothetical protein [Portunus trituberculatus]